MIYFINYGIIASTVNNEKMIPRKLIDNQIYLEATSGKRSDNVYGPGAVGIEYCRSQKYGSKGILRHLSAKLLNFFSGSYLVVMSRETSFIYKRIV